MSHADDVRVAAKSLWAHRFRSALSLLSIAIGAFAIVLMSSLAESGFQTLRRGIEELGGARLLLVVPKQPERAKSKAEAYDTRLTRLDHEVVLAGVPYIDQHCRYTTLHDKNVIGDSGLSLKADLVAADSRFFDFFSLPLSAGRRFDAEDDGEHAPVCLVGKQVAAGLWQGGALDRWLTIQGIRCRVIGELAARPRFGINLGFDWLKLVVMPAQTAADYLPEVERGGLIVARTNDAAHNDIVKRILNARLVERHHGIDDFSLLDFAGILRNFYAIFTVMQLLVGCIAGLALVVGGIGVMNMMLVSVSERVREIGIRKALGASPRQIRAQFLTEAALLSGVGGVLGSGFGVLCAVLCSALIVRLLESWVGLLSWPAVAAALGTALLTGVSFGWVPAKRASALSPVEAMRR
ncbi:MAG TPA: ABC transporter permease [Polyangiaceae bacterium]|nr:ABC transporter permease [Polyangiaceae bacterium]